MSALAFPLDEFALQSLVRAALDEDKAFDDVTTLATIPEARQAVATLVARSPGVIAGVPLACSAFSQLDPRIEILQELDDGAAVTPGDVVLRLTGPARAILSAERVALNFMQRLSGVATVTARFVKAVAGTNAQILDTRKTTPGWRALEKYAVRCGGGTNHRFDLADAVLIKDNHLVACDGSVAVAVRRARELAPHGTPIQVECDSVVQLRAAIEAGAESVLLDNMSNQMLRECVELARGHCLTEASGGVNLDTVRGIAECGVDRISIGALTHSAPSLDLALDFA